MRLRLALAACLLIATAAQVAAQVPGPAYTFGEVKAPEGATLPGATVTFSFTAVRVCSNSVDYLAPAQAKVDFAADDANFTVAGPGQVEFPEQVCAQSPQASVTFPATVAVPAGAAPAVHRVKAILAPEPSGPVPRSSQEATVDFLVYVAAPPSAAGKVAGEPAKASPAAAPVFLLGALALAALAARRGAA